MEDFPHFGNAWRAAARCREIERRTCLARLTRGADYQHSASIIQKRFRAYLETVPQETRDEIVEARSRHSAKDKLKRQSTARLKRSGSGVSKEGRKEEKGHGKIQTETDMGQSGGGAVPPVGTAAGTSGARMQAELRFELRNGLANFKTEMLAMMRDWRKPAEETSSWDGGTAILPSGPGAGAALCVADAAASLHALELDQPRRPSLTEENQKLKEENQKLRALVSEQKRQLDVVKELLRGSSLAQSSSSSLRQPDSVDAFLLEGGPTSSSSW